MERNLERNRDGYRFLLRIDLQIRKTKLEKGNKEDFWVLFYSVHAANYSIFAAC